MESNKVVAVIILAFVGILIGTVLVQVIASQITPVTSQVSVSNEQVAMNTKGFPLINETAVYTVTNAPTGWKSYDCPLTNFVIANSSGFPLVLTTDYTFTASAGTFQLVDNQNTNTTYGLYPGNKTYVSYTYCPDNYVGVSWGRTVLNLAPGFFVLGILGVGIGLVYYFMRKDFADD